MSLALRLLALAGLLALAPTMNAQIELPWVGDMDKALERAKAENKPILVCMHWAGEKACIQMLNNVYQNPDVAEAMRRDFILVGTSPDAHDEIEKGGKKYSALFRTVTCDELVRCEHRVKELYFSGPKVTVPQHIIVMPDGTAAVKKTYLMDQGKLRSFLQDFMIGFAGDAAKSLDTRLRESLETVRKGNSEDRKNAIRQIIEYGDAKVIELLYHTIQGIKKDKDRGECIRFMGYPELAAAGPILMRWAKDSEEYIQNCAVVSLEETEYAAAKADLDALYESAKDDHLKKDALRALAVCGAGDAAVKAKLLAAFESKDQWIRQAGYLGLQNFLGSGSDDVRTAMKEAYKKDDLFQSRGAIIFSYSATKDSDLIPDLQEMIEKEKNRQIAGLAEHSIKMLNGEAAEFERGMQKTMKSIFSGDKIIRNRVLDWGSGGGRGGGGRGGRRR